MKKLSFLILIGKKLSFFILIVKKLSFPFYPERSLTLPVRRSWTADTFLVRMTHLVHYYHIGTRSSRVRNYTIGPMTSARCPSCNYRVLMTQLISSNDGGVYRHPGCCGGHITPDRSPPRSCGIMNPINAPRR